MATLRNSRPRLMSIRSESQKPNPIRKATDSFWKTRQSVSKTNLSQVGNIANADVESLKLFFTNIDKLHRTAHDNLVADIRNDKKKSSNDVDVIIIEEENIFASS